MNHELMISWRYLATKRKEKFISLISVLSISGIAIGVMALILVIGVMDGFDNELRDKIVGNFAHIAVLGYNGIDAVSYDSLAAKIKENPHVKAVTPYIQGQVLVKQDDAMFAADIKGIDPKREINVSKVKDYVTEGSIEGLGENDVVIGRELASHFGLALNSDLLIYSPQGKPRTLKVTGIFSSGIYDYDFRFLFVNLKTAQDILGIDNRYSAAAVKLDNLYSADKITKELSLRLGSGYIAKSWTQMNENFFAALKLEKFTMFIILTLIVLVAAFNIASTLIVMVVEKTKDIGILRTIGVTSSGVRRIFTYQGLIIGTLGTAIGALCGIILCMVLKKYQFIKLPPVYSIERLPVSLVFWPDIALIVLAAMVITLLATIYPAVKAARLKPVEALRYE